MDYFHFQSLGWLGLSGKESLVRQDRMDHHCRIDSGWWQNDCRLKKIFTLFSFLSIRRAIRDWFVHDWEIEEFQVCLNFEPKTKQRKTATVTLISLKQLLSKDDPWCYERFDDVRILIIWRCFVLLFAWKTHLKVNLPEGLEASGAFAFEARVNLKGEDFRIPWSVEWISAL